MIKNTEPTGPIFSVYVLLEVWFVYHLPLFFSVHVRRLTKLTRRENDTKLKTKKNKNKNKKPRAHQVCIGNCFLEVSLFMEKVSIFSMIYSRKHDLFM